MSRECIEWGEETRTECAEYRDEGYNACASWDDRCCDWWPCSWGCKLITWICVAWYWVSNVVCVAWSYITTAVCLVWELVVTVVSFIVEVIGAVVGVLLDVIGLIVDLIFSIPIIGAFLKELWNVLTDIVWRIIGVIDSIAWAIGIRPEKKLRICTIILRDEKGPVADTAMVVEEINRMIDIYREEANIRVMPTSYFKLTSPFSDDEKADSSWIHMMEDVSDNDILDVHCGATAVGEDYWLRGSKFNLIMTTKCFLGNGRRLLGYGAPITVFVVRSIDGSSTTGCSIIFLSNYITVAGKETVDKSTIAHECGHACLLGDRSDPPDTNLMWGTDNNNRNKMTNWQANVVRNSKHVTYF